EGAVERVGLVEEGECLEPARREQAFERDLPSWHELLHQQRRREIAIHADVVTPEDGGDPPDRGDEGVGVVGADHAAARRERQGLQHARVVDLARRAYGILRQRYAAEPGRRDAGGVEPLTHLVLVAGGGGGGDRVGPEAQARTDRGGDDGGEIVHGDDRVDRPAAGEARDGLRGADGLGEVEGEQIVRRPLLERAGALGGADQVDAEPGGGVDERL